MCLKNNIGTRNTNKLIWKEAKMRQPFQQPSEEYPCSRVIYSFQGCPIYGQDYMKPLTTENQTRCCLEDTERENPSSKGL